MRLDVFLASGGSVKSRTRAAEMISGGFVRVNGTVRTKPSFEVSEADDVQITGEEHGFVGRGGIKLDAALTSFGIDVGGMICADIGASTGGFTDCLLRRGAAHVYAIDSGHGQLDESLLKDGRVTNLEGINARYMTSETLPEKCGIAVADVSFISETLILPAIKNILTPVGAVVALIKPQFECGKSALSKNGIVKDKKQHLSAIRQVIGAAVPCGLVPQKIILSPICGGDGNREFLIYLLSGGQMKISDNDIREAVYE